MEKAIGDCIEITKKANVSPGSESSSAKSKSSPRVMVDSQRSKQDQVDKQKKKEKRERTGFGATDGKIDCFQFLLTEVCSY